MGLMLLSNCFWSKILLRKTWKISAMRYQFSGILLPISWNQSFCASTNVFLVFARASVVLFSRVRHPNGEFSFLMSSRFFILYCHVYQLMCGDMSQISSFINLPLSDKPRSIIFAVVLFLGACTKPPRLSMITEYMELGSLYYLIHMSGQKKKLSWHRRLRMLRDICRYILMLPIFVTTCVFVAYYVISSLLSIIFEVE